MRFLLIPTATLLLASPLMAQYVPPVDPKTMLDSLQQMQAKTTKLSQSQLSQAIADFSAAAGEDNAALNFYMQAIYVTRFKGRQGADADFRDWKKRVTDDNVLSPVVIRTCLLYMTISLQRLAGATDQQTVSGLLGYLDNAQSMLAFIGDNKAALDDTADASPTPGQRMRGRRADRQPGQPQIDTEIVETPINANIFATWYGIGDQLKAIPKWELTPIALDSIADKYLLPTMRKNHDRAIFTYWNSKITWETQQASKSNAAFGVDSYNQTRLPTLLWDRATDTILLGFRDQGLNEMFQLIKQNPAHPSAAKWIAELKGLLTNPTTMPPPPTVSTGA